MNEHLIKEDFEKDVNVLNIFFLFCNLMIRWIKWIIKNKYTKRHKWVNFFLLKQNGSEWN